MTDFKRFRFGKYGVEGLAWPFPMQTIDEFSEKFFFSLENFKRECIPTNEEIKDAFDVSLIYIILDTASLYQAAILAEKNKMLGPYLDVIRNSSPLLNSAIEKQNCIAPLAQSFSRISLKRSYSRDFLRFFTGGIRPDGVSRRPPELIRGTDDILCFWFNPEMKKFAEANGKFLVLGRLDQWFIGARDTKVHDDEIISVAKAISIRASECVSGLIKKTKPWFQETAFLSSKLHLQTALGLSRNFSKKFENLPDELWLTSSASIFNRILSQKAKASKSRVIFHDHGCGSGWFSLKLQVPLQFDFGDEIRTFTNAQAKGISELQKTVAKDLKNPNRKTCRSISTSPFRLFSPPKYKGKPNNQLKKLMFVPSLYCGERYRLPQLQPDPIAADYQTRLLAFSEELGFEVLVKPHPESVIQFPIDVQGDVGARIVDGLFEECMNKADILVFDYPATTSVRSAFFTNLPIIFLDIGRIEILESAKLKLEQRVARLKASVSPSNTFQFSRQDLKYAIDEAFLKRNSRCFFDSYFSEK